MIGSQERLLDSQAVAENSFSLNGVAACEVATGEVSRYDRQLVFIGRMATVKDRHGSLKGLLGFISAMGIEESHAEYSQISGYEMMFNAELLLAQLHGTGCHLYCLGRSTAS
jgi:hypothetical protein